jgi:hypothetical protein
LEKQLKKEATCNLGPAKKSQDQNVTPARLANSGFADSTIKKPIGKNTIIPSNLPNLGISSPIVEKLESSRPAHPCFSPKRREKT